MTANQHYTPAWETDLYPLAVQRIGLRGMQTFDACMRELTADGDLSEEDARDIIMLHWPEISAALGPNADAPGSTGSAGSTRP